MNTPQLMQYVHHGKLHLRFKAVGGKTKLTQVYQQPPLKASRAMYSRYSRDVLVYIMESSGGMHAGDRSDIVLNLAENSRVKIVQQSALKVYPAHDSRSAKQTIQAHLEEGARLKWMPETVIPFKDAEFSLETQLHLAQNASLIWGEILAPGREMRGEVFDFTSLDTRFEIYRDHELLAFDRLNFIPEHQRLQTLGVLGHNRYIGSVWLIDRRLTPGKIKALQKYIPQNDLVQGAISQISDGAYHCRLLGRKQWPLQQAMQALIEQVETYLDEIVRNEETNEKYQNVDTDGEKAKTIR